MAIVFKNRLLVEPGATPHGYIFTEKELKRMKVPKTIPLLKEFDPNKVLGEVKNIHWDAGRKGVVGDLIFNKVIPFTGYGAKLSVERITKMKIAKELDVVEVASVRNPISAKFKLRVRNRKWMGRR